MTTVGSTTGGGGTAGGGRSGGPSVAGDTRILVGVDTGGTFTDFVVFGRESIEIHKEPSTPDDPARAILNGLHRLFGDSALRVDLVHGSTVATNALLERRGARTLLVTTAGFEDLLEIGRQTRRSIYDLNVTKPAPLVPAEFRLGVEERVDSAGRAIVELQDGVLAALLERVGTLKPESVAICLLHSYANVSHENRIKNAVEQQFGASLFVTASHEVLPEFREYERTSTTTINAYVGPVMQRYLGNLAAALAGSRISIMQSNGGIMSLDAAQRLAVHTVLSGPAGGAVGGLATGKRAGYENVISFDMGGTSTDVSLAAGAPGITSEGSIGELPLRVPVIDIHTVGAGGGSVAYVDPGGSLRVGPRSAGAVPGPICYDRGGIEVTVTDANLYLGRLSPLHFLGGTQELNTEAARAGVSALAKRIGLTPEATAEGVIRVVNAAMERAIRVISLERGHDPRDFTLICFGGAGGMHAAELADALGIPRVLVPPAAGALSALGMLLADFARDYSHTVLTPLLPETSERLEQEYAELIQQARRECDREGIEWGAVTVERSMDVRYTGQGYELSVTDLRDVAAEFNRLHEQRYGYADPGRRMEVVNVRLRASVKNTRVPPVTVMASSAVSQLERAGAAVGTINMYFAGETHAAPVINRALLTPGGATLDGPALIVEYSTTTVVPPNHTARMDAFGNLILERRHE